MQLLLGLCAGMVLTAAAPARAANLRTHLSCPPFSASPRAGNDPAQPADPHATPLANGATVTCQVLLSTDGAVTDVDVTLELPRDAELALADEERLPDGVRLATQQLFPAVGTWRFGRDATSVSGFAPGTWDAQTRVFSWHFPTLGRSDTAATQELRVSFRPVAGIPPGDYPAELRVSLGGSAQADLTRTALLRVGPNAGARPAVQGTRHVALGGRLVLRYYLTAGETFTPHTNAELWAVLPYWDPTDASQPVKTDLAFDPSRHKPLVSYDALEARLFLAVADAQQAQTEAVKPAGTDVGPESGQNAGRLIRLDRSKNRLVAQLGTYSSIAPGWELLVRAPFVVPAGTSEATVAGRTIAGRACLVSDQKPGASPVCATGGTATVVAGNSPQLIPQVMLLPTQKSPVSGTFDGCEFRPFLPNVPYSLVGVIDVLAGDDVTTAEFALQTPGRTQRDAELLSLALSVDPTKTAYARDLRMDLTTRTGSYGNVEDLRRRVLGAPAEWVECPLAAAGSAAACEQADLDAAGIPLRLADVTEVRLRGPRLEPGLWAHVWDYTQRLKIEASYRPLPGAPRSTVSAGGNAVCDQVNCTGAAYCAAARLAADTIPEVSVTATAEVDGRVKLDVAANSCTSHTTCSLPGYNVSTFERGTYWFGVANGGSVHNVYGPIEFEARLPPNALLDTSDQRVPSGRSPMVLLRDVGGRTKYAPLQDVQFTSERLPDGGTLVKARVTVVSGAGDLPQVDDGAPSLFGAADQDSSVRAVFFAPRVMFMPGIARRAAAVGGKVSFQLDADGNGIPEPAARTFDEPWFSVTNVAPALSLQTTPTSEQGTAAGPRELILAQGAPFSLDLALDNSAWDDQSQLRADGARISARDAVVYQRLPRPESTGLPPVFFEAKGLRWPDLPQNDVRSIWVRGDEATNAMLVAGAQLADAGWTRCAVVSEAEEISCDAPTARAALGGAEPLWVAFQLGEAFVTDAPPRGVSPLSGAARQNRPFRAALVARDAGNEPRTRFAIDSLVASTDTLLARGAPVTIRIENQPPRWVEPIRVTGSEGVALTFTALATDPDRDPITYAVEASTLPHGASFDATTRVFSWTPSFTQSGVRRVTFNVSDGDKTTTAEVELDIAEVNRPPVLADVSEQQVPERTPLTFTLTATDPDGDRLTYSADGLPEGAVLNPTTGVVTWTPGPRDGGTYDVLAEVDDGRGGTDDTPVRIVVTAVDEPPVVGLHDEQVVPEGEHLTFPVTASDPDGEAVDFTADSGSLPAFCTFGTTAATFDCSPGFDDAGRYEVGVVATAGALSGTGVVVVTVIDVNRPPLLDETPQQTLGEGEPLVLDVTATDPDGDLLVFTGVTLPEGASIDADGQFTWTPPFGAAGTHHVDVQVSDGRGGTDSGGFDVLVERRNQPPVVTAPPAPSVRPGRTATVTFHVSDPDGQQVTCTAADLPAGATYDDTTRRVEWTPSQADADSQVPVRLDCSDGELTGSGNGTIVVKPAVNHVGGGLASMSCSSAAPAGMLPLLAAFGLVLRRRVRKARAG